MPRPPGPDISDSDKSFDTEDENCAKMWLAGDTHHPDADQIAQRDIQFRDFAILDQWDPEEEEDEKKKKKKKKSKSAPKKRSEMTQLQRSFENKKDRIREGLETDLYQKDLLTRDLFQADYKNIQYFDKPDTADDCAKTLINAMTDDFQEYYFFGFDAEGKNSERAHFGFDVFQIYTKVNGSEFYLIFNVARILVDGQLPQHLFSLFDDRRIVLIGKDVKPEAIGFLMEFGFSQSRINSLKVHDVLTSLRLSCLLSRPSIEDAIEFVTNFSYTPITQYKIGILNDIYENASLLLIFHYFRPDTIDKRKLHVHPTKVDWSCSRNNQHTHNLMTRPMRIYAATDPYASVMIFEEAVKIFQTEPEDLIQIHAPNLDYTPFLERNLLNRFSLIKDKQCSAEELNILARIKTNHELKIEEAKARWLWHNERFVRAVDAWKSATNYDARRAKEVEEERRKRREEEEKEKQNEQAESSAEILVQPSATAATPVAAAAAAAASAAVAAAAAAASTSASTSSSTAEPAAAAAASTVAAAAAAAPAAAASAAAASLQHPGIKRISTSYQVGQNESGIFSDNSVDMDDMNYSPSQPTPPSPTHSLSSTPSPKGFRDRSPLRPPVERSGRSSASGGSELWYDDVTAFRRTDFNDAAALVRQLIEREEEQKVVDRLIFILEALDLERRRPLVYIFYNQLPFRLRRNYVIDITQNKTLYDSYLDTLANIMHGGLGGVVILDELQRDFDNRRLHSYLLLITKKQAQDFVDVALTIFAKTPDETLQYLRQHPLFDSYYSDRKQISARWTDERLADLVVRVTKFFDLQIPLVFKNIRIELFYNFLFQEFKDGKIFTDDFINMVEEAFLHYDLGASAAIEFFQSRIHDVARHFAAAEELAVDDASENDFPFVDPPCEPEHKTIYTGLNCSEHYIISDDGDLITLSYDLGISDCLAILANEPPALMPNSRRIDFFSLRTKERVYHILTEKPHHLAQKVVNLLRDFNRNNPIYARNPNNYVQYFHDSFSWAAELTDVRPAVDAAAGVENSSLTDIARLLFGVSTFCWRGQHFSASRLPSREVLRHSALAVNLVFQAGVDILVPRAASASRPVSTPAEAPVAPIGQRLSAIAQESEQQATRRRQEFHRRQDEQRRRAEERRREEEIRQEALRLQEEEERLQQERLRRAEEERADAEELEREREAIRRKEEEHRERRRKREEDDRRRADEAAALEERRRQLREQEERKRKRSGPDDRGRASQSAHSSRQNPSSSRHDPGSSRQNPGSSRQNPGSSRDASRDSRESSKRHRR